jgi:ATP-dependent Clp protease ATP-binding subunit ClpA
LRSHFRPEFLNRIDETVIFSNLERTELRAIVEQYAAKLARMVAERGLKLELTPAAIDWLSERGYDRDFGARPMKRVFQREVQNPLAVEILSGKYGPGATVRVDVSNGSLQFRPVTA